MPQTSRARARQLREILEGNHARVLTVGMIVTFACLALIGWNIWRSYQTVQRVHDQQLQLQALMASIARLDDGLTAYVRLSAITGDSRWEQLYQESETKIRESAAEVIRLAAERGSSDSGALNLRCERRPQSSNAHCRTPVKVDSNKRPRWSWAARIRLSAAVTRLRSQR